MKETRDAVTSSWPFGSGTVIVADVTQSETPQVSSLSANSPSEVHVHPASVSEDKHSIVRAFAGYTPLVTTYEATFLPLSSSISNTDITEGCILG